MKKDTTYLDLFKATLEALEVTLFKQLADTQATELNLAKSIQSLPLLKTALFIGNGLLIRAFDHLFHPKDEVGKIYSSRGVSGIDGNIATIAGIAAGSEQKLLAFIGDQAFLHDANSLPLIRELAITLIVVNNGGGGIFETLPMSQDRKVANYIVNPHHEQISSIAESFGLRSATVSTLEQCITLIEEGGFSVIELLVDREKSTKQWSHLMEEIASTKRSTLMGALSCYFT